VTPIALDCVRSSRKIERMPTLSHPPPNVRLRLLNQPENVSLIRTTLAGVAEAINLPLHTLDDIQTAVTEAANNVVLHAYEGDRGSLEVDIDITPSAIAVVIRDEGVGIPASTQAQDEDGALELSEIDSGSLKLGLPVIEALASRVELHTPASGGAEVRMEFATPPTPPLDVSPRDGLALPLIELLSDEAAELITATAITITPDRVARTVLPRLVCALAARANFSTDRLSDAQLLADSIAAQAFQAIIGNHLGVRIAVEPRQVELRVGPLPAGHSDKTTVDSVLGELAPIVQRLADDHSLTSAGPASVLALQLIDRR
jgi:serine/threonine-protein kinase RsbW